ncbi:MAG: 4-(cytidine 5'-diphospho)-2-C-methyl-D-erythritol kinase [Gammaproteobacteria bacterium]|nr:4-(cytidine 5'-diphospho)-2-C-methyl-D-erythritol kinase [Gammaproteobacteria bacterium]
MSGPELSGYWPAPAKLNLMLRVVGRRPDGYHLLQTVFQFLDFGDRLRFRIRSDGLLRRLAQSSEIPHDQDLVIQAGNLLKDYTGTEQGADIHLDKNLPMGAGLGGGSSDAATVLVALNHLWNTGLSVDTLAELGLRLGADVPVFVRGEAAWGEGVGEELTPLDLPQPWFLVLVPECHVPTAQIFGDPHLTRDSPRIKIRDFLDGNLTNDCLPVVARHFPQVREALDWLGSHSAPRLTGTGACVFAGFERRKDAFRVYEQVPERFHPILAQGMSRSPLNTAESLAVSVDNEYWGVAKR